MYADNYYQRTMKKILSIFIILTVSLAVSSCSNTDQPAPGQTATDALSSPKPETQNETPVTTATPQPTNQTKTPEELAEEQKNNKLEFARIIEKSYQTAVEKGLMEFRSNNTFIGAYDARLPEGKQAASLDNNTGKYKLLRTPDGYFIILSTQMVIVGIDKGFTLPPEATYTKQGDGTWLVVTPKYMSEGWEVPESTKTYLIDKNGLISKVFVKATPAVPAYNIEIFYGVDDFGRSILDRAAANSQ